MANVDAICEFLESFAPLELAEDWDNVGLLLGHRQQTVHRIMVCLTVTPTTAAEAVDGQAELIVTHHPIPFRPLPRICSDTIPGRLVLTLAENRIAVYSPHTAFDSAGRGINQQLAEIIGLRNIVPLVPSNRRADGLGAGRRGELSGLLTAGALAEKLKTLLDAQRVCLVGEPERAVCQIGVACGSAGQFLTAVHQAGCDMLVTGEASFHTCLESEALGVALILLGHFASERFAVARLSEILAAQFPDLHVWASRRERDPLRIV